MEERQDRPSQGRGFGHGRRPSFRQGREGGREGGRDRGHDRGPDNRRFERGGFNRGRPDERHFRDEGRDEGHKPQVDTFEVESPVALPEGAAPPLVKDREVVVPGARHSVLTLHFKDMAPAVLRGTALGSCLGILPGGGALLSAFAAYTLEKKIKGRPGEVPFGQGNIRGVAAPESANNAGSQTSFIPLLTLGIPPNAVMALMVGAMTIHNIQPGPQVMTSNPELFWGLIASMWIGNAMLVILNLPLIGIWIKLLTIPYRLLFPAIVLFCAIGVYSTNNNTWDIWMVAIFGVIGYIFIKLGAEPAPLLLGFILGPMMEENLRRALLLSRGDWSVFVTRPLSAGLLAAGALLLLIVLLPAVKNKREEAFVED